jgi:hypothetical protein
VHIAVAAPSLVKNTGTSSPTAYQRQAPCPVKLRPAGSRPHPGEPRIAETRPRCRRRSADPWRLGAATPGRRCLLNGAVAPLSPNDRTSCNQARPVADMTVPKLLQPKRVWPSGPTKCAGLACAGAQPQPHRSPANQARAPIDHDRQPGAPPVAAARHDPHRNAQTATRLVDQLASLGEGGVHDQTKFALWGEVAGRNVGSGSSGSPTLRPATLLGPQPVSSDRHLGWREPGT